MSLESHVRELQRKHEALEAQIAEASNHPSSDELEITALKKRKLKLKDEIERHRMKAA